jgi:enoyl-CoA hydratase/carnithine racemase
MAKDLSDALNYFEENMDLKVLVLTGAGKQFCAGADLRAFKKYIQEELSSTHEAYNARVLFPITQRLCSFRMPVIAAVNGAATAGGLDLALACDMRIASEKAKIGETYIKLGLNPGNGGTYFMPRLIGSGLAAEMALTGDIIDANRALEIGLVNRIVPAEELITETLNLAERISRHSRLALEATKHQLRHSWHMDLSATLNLSFWGASNMTHTQELLDNIDKAIADIDARKT